jgi:sugar-phosphatase
VIERAFDCAAVLFDADGVLVDSDASVISAWSRWAAAYDLDPERVVQMVHGRRSADTVALLVPDNQEQALRDVDNAELADAAKVRAIPGARTLLDDLDRAGTPWAVVTSATRALARARHHAAELPVPAATVTADDLRDGKPDPAGYRMAAQLLGVPPSACVVMEDSPSGIAAARAAGVRAVIGVSVRAASHDPDAIVQDLTSVRVGPEGLLVDVSHRFVSKTATTPHGE